jgi:para-nitrobenzyl esterase
MKKTSPGGIVRALDRRDFVKRASLLGAGLLLEHGAFGQATPGAVVETPEGKLRGLEHKGIHVFKGIKYGAPTGGANRFMAPARPAPWTGIRNAFQYGHQSPQNMHFTDVLAPQADPKEGFEEDCLCLNVWTPGVNDGNRRPVMFWIHGGGFAQESGSWPWIDGEALARRGDVVVITINHRLNVFGYLHLGDIGGEKYAASGNAGMLDLVAGLQWVRDNISKFGGDPGNVLIFGESGGGAKVCTLLTMPSAKGLFHRAAIQSGAFLRVADREEANRLAHGVLDELGISAQHLDDIQKVPKERLLGLKNGTMRVDAAGKGAPRMGFQPVVDGKIVTTHPFDPAAPALAADIPLLIGNTQFEATLFLLDRKDVFELDAKGLTGFMGTMVDPSAVERAIAAYRKDYPAASPSDIALLASTDRIMRLSTITAAQRKASQGKAPVYAYSFNWRSPAEEGRLRAPHTVEIPFVFHNTDIPTVMTKSPSATALADKTADAWIAFARTADPNHPGLPHWPAYTPGVRATMAFDNACHVVNDPGSASRQFWENG